MKRIIRGLIFFLLSILIFSIGASVYYSQRLNIMMSKDVNNNGFIKKDPNYHVIAILHKGDEPYWKGIERGITEKAKEYNIALEVSYTNLDKEYEETKMYLEMAIASSVEGILVHGYETEEFKELVNSGNEKGIPIITIDSDCEESQRVSYAGINDFELGIQMAKQVIQGLKGEGNIALILENKGNKSNDEGNTIVSGINDVLKDYPGIKLDIIKLSDKGIIGAKSILQDIIVNHPEVNGIICTSSNDTIGITQQLVDYNKVGDYTIIGYDNTEEILSYIEKNVIYSTVVPDGEKIGRESINALVKKKESGYVSSYVLTDISVINEKNIKQYIKKE